ncbi:MAG: ABC transporter permease [Candidatus Marsarchaeota archaeon]|jgi:ABC-2 type transport system permease protein|nr:ABC transporter permease [Candidatus Marsarchaeota archaeon]
MGLLGDSFTLYRRELYIFRSKLRTNIIRSIMFPLILILLLGNIGNVVSNVNTYVVNYANNPASVQFINQLTTQSTLSISGIVPQAQAMAALANNTVSLVIVILPTFPDTGQSPSVEVYYSNSQINQIGTALPFVGSIADKFGAQVYSGGQSLYQQSPPASLSIAVPTTGTTSSYKDFLVGGIIIMVAMFGSVFGGGMTIITDRQLGNLKAFLATPINKSAIIVSKLLAGTTFAVINGAVAVVIGLLDGAGIAMGVIGIPWIFLFIVMVALGFSGVTTILASRISRIDVYTIAAQSVTLPLWFLSGAFFPTTSLPSWIYPLSVINPMTYAADGVRDVMLSGYFPANSMALDLGVMLVFIVFGIVLSFKLFKGTIE